MGRAQAVGSENRHHARPAPRCQQTGVVAAGPTSLASAGAPISREHYVRRTLWLSPHVTVSGLPGSDGPRTIGLDAMVIRSLCRTHNEALSDLDQAAGDVVRTWRWLNELRIESAPPSPPSALAVVVDAGSKSRRDGLTREVAVIRVDYFSEWRAQSFSCRCGWQGTGGDLESEVWEGLVTLDCPSCSKTVAGFPHLTREEIEEAAGKGHPDAVAMLRERSER